MSEWKEVRLGDICSELSDGLHKAPLFVEGGDYIFVNAKNLCDGVIVDNDPTKKTTHEEYLKYSKPLNENTILFSIDGTIGNIARYKGEKCVLGKGACYINPNPVLVDSSYIYFQLQSPHFNSYLNCMSTGSTIKHISLKTMRNYEFTLPPLSEQRSIASILSALDDKIAVNRRICENLEAQAQALFKHWFIDFAPFKNGKFVESELGMIPEGWRVESIGKLQLIVTDYVANGSFASLKENVKLYQEEEYAYFIRNTDLKSGKFGVYVDKHSYEFLSKSRLYGGEIIISNVGDVGSVFLCPRLNKPMTLGNNIIMVKSEDAALNTYLYLLFRCSFGQGLIRSITGGSAQPKFNKTDFKSLKIIMPSSTILANYVDNLLQMINIIEAIKLESTRLSTLRDTLLPKLMSGQIKV